MYIKWRSREGVFGAWVGCGEDSCKQEKARVLVGRWGDWRIWMCECVDQVRLDRLNGLVELWAGGLCLEVHRIMPSDAIQMCLRRRHPLTLLALMFIPRRDVG